MSTLKKSDWKVKPIGYAAALELVTAHHYAKSASKNAVALHGLYLESDAYNVAPFGVCWWLPLPSKISAQFFHADYKNVLCLSRMVIVPNAPKNAASFLLARSIRMLPARYHTLATYADTWQGHTGHVYKAANWQYRGITEPKPVWIDENGVMSSLRKGQKTLKTGEMHELGLTFCGYYAKHRYVYYRYPAKTTHQLSMFTTQELI